MVRPCAACGCERKVPAKLLMCPVHWRMVPKNIKQLVWDHYQRGQELAGGPRPTRGYFSAAAMAVDAIALAEGRFPVDNPFREHLDALEAQAREAT